MQEIFRFRQTGVSADGHGPGQVRGDRHPPALPRPGHGARHHPFGRPVPARREVRRMNPTWLRALVLVCIFGAVVLAVEALVALDGQQPRRGQGDQPAAEDDRPRPDPRRDDEHPAAGRLFGARRACRLCIDRVAHKFERMLMQAQVTIPTGTADADHPDRADRDLLRCCSC